MLAFEQLCHDTAGTHAARLDLSHPACGRTSHRALDLWVQPKTGRNT